jgi:hypothetical protein
MFGYLVWKRDQWQVLDGDQPMRFKAWFCGSILAGIVGSNPAGGMDVCLS